MRFRDWAGVVAMTLVIAALVFATWHSMERNEKYRKCCEKAERCK